MAERDQPLPWARCDHNKCIGIQLDNQKCLAHCDEDERRATLDRLRQGEALNFTPGVPIALELLRDIIDAAPNGRLRNANFSRATFVGEAAFGGIGFEDGVNFIAATFEKQADFYGTVFSPGPRAISFSEAIFEAGVSFHSRFQGNPNFSEATFKGPAFFSESTFEGNANFWRCTFHGTLRVELSSFNRSCNFNDAIFRDQVVFGRAPCREGQLSFREATFEKAIQLGRLLAKDAVVLDNAVFQQRLEIKVSAAMLLCRRVRFLDGVHMRLRWAGVALDGADLAHPAILSSSSHGEPEEADFQDHLRSWPGPPRPDASLG